MTFGVRRCFALSPTLPCSRRPSTTSMPEQTATQNLREKYGVKWHAETSDLHIELQCFREDSARFGIDPERRPFHFKNIVSTLYGKNSKKHFIWNPWADAMLINACREKYLSLSGAASSGKTHFGALWGFVNWLSLPTKTLVLLTSTSLEEARRRVWGDIEGFFHAGNESLNSMVKGLRLPGRLLGSTGKIRTQDGDQKFDDKCGIQLISGDRAKEKENIGKLIGLKNQRVFLIADELPELSPSLVEAAKSNLMTNPFFQMVGLGNFASIYDPFGEFSEPKDGWSSVSPECDEWRTKDGLCLRFDGLRSPNVMLGTQKYPGMYGPEHLRQHRDTFGENTSQFWRMCRSFPCPEADADRIYSEADLLKGDVKGTVKWLTTPVKCASLDPAFATGGDRASVKIGTVGTAVSGVQTLQVQKHVELREDVRKKDESRSTQVAKQFRDLCISEGIDPRNVAIDASGGGLPFAALLAEVWTDKFLSVFFGGAASGRPASVKDRRPAKDAFQNRVAELWYAGVDFVQGGQIKGLNSQTCVELTERRKLVERKGVSGLKIRIESKSDMKLRTKGKSPDEGDSFLLLLELARERLNFRAVGMEGQRANAPRAFQNRTRLISRVYQNANYEPEVADA